MKADRNEARVREARRRGGRVWLRLERGEERHKLSSNGGRAKQVHVVGVGQEHPTVAEAPSHLLEDGVEPEGEELSTKGAALTHSTLRKDNSRWASRATHVELSRRVVE